MKNLYKIIFFLVIVFFTNSVSAMSLIIDPSKDSVSIGEEFYIDVKINIENQNINGIEGTILYDNTKLEFVRSENSRSFITHWINSPNISGNGEISFSGIEPNGFSGFLNKTRESLNTGLVTRIIFRPIKNGSSVIGLQNIFTTANDGEGTTTKLKDIGILIQIDNIVKNSQYKINDLNNPVLNAEIVNDKNLYNGQTTLVFNAIDKDSGIEGVYIKTKNQWVKINNPYSLNKVDFGVVLTVKAVDYSGNTDVKKFLLPGYGVNIYRTIFISITILVLFVTIRYIYKKYAKNKKHL